MGASEVLDAFVIELPLPPKILSPNGAQGRMWVKAKAKKWYREGCYYMALQAMPKGWAAIRVELDVEYRCSGTSEGYAPRDSMNAMAAMKAGIDGLIDAGVAPDDSNAHLSWGALSLITRRSPKGDGITITVRKQS